MHYVYIIVSVPHPGRYYVGLTRNVRQRLGHHNQGIVRSAPFRPWRLRSAICFLLDFALTASRKDYHKFKPSS